MATQSNSPSHGDFAAVASSKSNEEDLLVRRNRQLRGSETSPHNGFGVHSPEFVPPQSTGTDPVRSAANRVSESDSADSVNKQIVETDFAELKDGTLVELVQDSENSRRTLLAVWKDGELRYLSQLEHDNYVLVPLRRKNEIFKRLRLPTAMSPYESVQTLLSRIERLISRCVSVDAKYVPVLADFVLSTWLVDRFLVAPYLSVVGLPQSGKTTLLKVLSLVCRRSLLIADITSASFYRTCAQFMPTMLIDEAGSVRNNSALRHILRVGTTRDVVSVQANCTFHAYGAKVISWLEPPDDSALNSRCVLIPMCETTRTDLVRPSDFEVEREAATLQAQLLQFRFENYRRVQPGPISGDEVLRPRSRDLLRVLSAAHLQDVKRSQRLLEFFESGQAVPHEPLSPEQNAVLRALYSLIHIRKDYVSIQTGDLTEAVNYFLRCAGESLRLQPRKVGAVLTSLGFSNRTRTNSGWFVSLNREDAEKLHQLAEHYGIDRLNGRFQEISLDDCDLCRAAAGKNRNRAPEVPKGRLTNTLDLREVLNPQRM
jgi:hypothetical protein